MYPLLTDAPHGRVLNDFAASPCSAQPVVLVIDGDPLEMIGMAATLEHEGYECHCAQDAAAAERAARDLSLDLVICDLFVGNQSGLELCRRLRNKCGCAETPFMFLSATQGPDVARRAMEAGGAYFLRKPFDPRVLIELAEQALWMPHLVQAQFEGERASSKPVHTAPSPHMRRLLQTGKRSAKVR